MYKIKAVIMPNENTPEFLTIPATKHTLKFPQFFFKCLKLFSFAVLATSL